MTDAATACACGTCASCSGSAPRPPVADPLIYRHGAIKARMLNRIAGTMIEARRPLEALRTRDDSDPSIALIDAFAGSLHILAYSAARLSDDGSIRRTQDRDSLVNLTRMLGYEPRPALSASTTISFAVNTLPGGPARTTVPVGTRIASVPEQDERPQSFETGRDLDVRAEWNAIRPAVPTRPFRVRKSTKWLRIDGTASAAKIGDLVLAYMTDQPADGTAWLAGRIAAVERVPENSDPPPREAGSFPDRTAPPFTRLQLRSTSVLKARPAAGAAPLRDVVVVLAQRAAAFGNNAPNMDMLDAKIREAVEDTGTHDWKNLEMLVPDAPDTAPAEKLFDAIVFGEERELLADAGERIAAAAQAYWRAEAVRIILRGYSDGRNSAEANLAMSERLAGEVRDALVQRDIPLDDIDVEALGDTRDEGRGHLGGGDGESKGTRVEIVFVHEVRDSVVDLDAVHPPAMQGRIVLFESDRKEADQQVGTIRRVAERSRTGFGLSAKVSRVWLDGIDLSNETGFNQRVRQTSIFIETARETLIRAGRNRVLPGEPYDRLTMLGKVDLPAGRRAVLRGELCGRPVGELCGETVTIAEVTSSGDGNSIVRFERSINSKFRAMTLALLGNSAQATHGEAASVEPELLGSADIRRLAPRYRLKGWPLSYVPAVNARGYEAALEVRVLDRSYKEVPTLWGMAPDAQVYTAQGIEGGKTEIQFAGRLKTASNSVTATYRIGSGTAGNLATGRLTTIMTPVLGITGAINPVPSEGGSDAETLEDMRSSAPQSIRTLDRVVSLSDFEVFARRFRGVGKALATELHVGMRKMVFLTIATTELNPPAPASNLIDELTAALTSIAVPGRVFRIAGFDDLRAELVIELASGPGFRRSNVEDSVRAVLAHRFSRTARQFGQALTRSEVLGAVHSVGGVTAARVSGFALAGQPQEPGERLLSPAPAISGDSVTLAGLLWLDPADVQFEEMRP